MQTGNDSDDARREAERYRRAAEDILDQLQWCVNYLNRIGKSQIAAVIERNHRVIRAGMRDDE